MEQISINERGIEARRGGPIIVTARPTPAGWQVVNKPAKCTRLVPDRAAAAQICARILRMLAA